MNLFRVKYLQSTESNKTKNNNLANIVRKEKLKLKWKFFEKKNIKKGVQFKELFSFMVLIGQMLK